MMNFPFELIGPTLISLSVGILFYVLLYMIGNLTSKQEVKGMATESFADLSTAFIYVIIAFILFGFIENATLHSIGMGGLIKDTSDSFKIDPAKLSQNSQMMDFGQLPLISVGEAYLLVMYYQAEKLYRGMILSVGFMNLMSSISIGGGGGEDIVPFRGYDPILNFASSLLTSTSALLMTFSAQLFLLKFFAHIIPTILFPLGILFRVLAPTKGFGGALIALCFAMYFVYPLVLSYNFSIMIKVLGVENVNLDSIIYNMPLCENDDECNSGKCVEQKGGVKYCETCVLLGEVPDNSPDDICCVKVSEMKVSDNGDKECSLKYISDKDQVNSFGKGGVITSPKSIQNTIYIAVFAMILLLIVFSTIGGGLFAVITGFFGLILGGATTFAATTPALSFIFNPITVFVSILSLSSKFFFLGFILPAVEFIVLIEFVRVLTGSMGESIDIMDMFKVI